MAQIYTKYRTSKKTSSRKSGGWVYWVLSLACIGVLGWIGWHYSRSSEKEAPKQPFAETNKVRSLKPTNVLVLKTNLTPAPSLPKKAETAITNITLAPVLSTGGVSITVTAKPPISVTVTSVPPAVPTEPGTRTVRSAYEAQLALAREGISPGSLDGSLGSQTRAALRAFQLREHLPVTGELDSGTKSRLFVPNVTERALTITSNESARFTPVGTTWLMKSQQARLDYQDVLEFASETSWSHPNLIRLLNASMVWSNVTAGTTLRVPDVRTPPFRSRLALIRIRLAERVLEGFDSNNQLLIHFPCSIAQRVEKRPVGQLFVEKIALNPNYRFDPEVFPESAEARKLKRPLMIPPGPNNPVGTAWIGLNRPGYGIHGTPRPEEVGRTESHGCFRLANWNAEYLAQLVRVGTPVYVEP